MLATLGEIILNKLVKLNTPGFSVQYPFFQMLRIGVLLGVMIVGVVGCNSEGSSPAESVDKATDRIEDKDAEEIIDTIEPPEEESNEGNEDEGTDEENSDADDDQSNQDEESDESDEEETDNNDQDNQDNQDLKAPDTYSLDEVPEADYLIRSDVNFRRGPSTDYQVIRALRTGTTVEVLGQYQDWYKVSEGNQLGFVHRNYVTTKSALNDQETVSKTVIDGVLIVNKGYGLPRDYAPGESHAARQQFEAMKKEASRLNYQIEAFSTYRSYQYQKELYNRYVNERGQQAADTFSARPGHSEHQTGLAFDIGWDGYYTDERMGSTATGKWMVNNSWKFGFILRYPKGKDHITGYKYEPWHFRYLGKDVAKKVYDSGVTMDEYFGVVAPDYS